MHPSLLKRSPKAMPAKAGIIASTALAAALALMQPGELRAQAAPETAAAWRVECTGDGHTLECRAIQQIFPTRYPAAGGKRGGPLRPRYQGSADVIAAAAGPQPHRGGLPEGRRPARPSTSRSRPATIPVVLVTMVPNDKFLAAMRTGTDLKVTIQDASKKPIEMSLPLLGFGVAYDKTK